MLLSIQASIVPGTQAMTDEAEPFRGLILHFAGLGYVSHRQHRRASGIEHTKTIEDYCSECIRGMQGISRHCAMNHVHRYDIEYDLKYNQRTKYDNNEQERCQAALRSIPEKRLIYKTTYREEPTRA
jgi:hypothetical protein